MKTRTLLLTLLVFGCAFAFAAATTIAAGMPDVIGIHTPYKMKKGPVKFTHKKHVEEHKLACGECHHDDQGKPRNDLKEGDTVKKCFDCHNKPGELKGKKAKGKSKKEKLAYHANALHKNCIGCHKAYNKKHKTKAAPQKCTGCHPKKKKK